MFRPSFPAFAAIASLPWIASCQAGFEPRSLVDSLRVLAVRPEPASGAPGETVRLEILVADGSARDAGDPARPVEIAWLGGCHNPASRLYFDCFPTLSSIAERLSPSVAETPPDALPLGAFGVGTTFSLPIPDDILTSAPLSQNDAARFGVSYVFFAACAGELRPRPSRRDQVPLACVNPATGRDRGPNDFVQGFATLFTFEGARNENPILTGVRFGSLAVVDQECAQDSDCDALAAPGKYACLDSRRCAPVVRRCRNEGDCRRILVFPDVAPESAEVLPGEGAREIVWANFYATDGDFDTGTQLVNDRVSGFIDQHGAYFRPPLDAGRVELFVTVHDQRGGTAWSSFEIAVRD
jgi:hypothetical protein